MKAIQPLEDKIRKSTTYPFKKLGVLLLVLLLAIYYFLAISNLVSNH
ncbi:hypothetical protein ACFO7M_00045 [Flavobacterium sp. GCM10023249]